MKQKLLAIYKKYIQIVLSNPNIVFILLVVGCALALVPKFYQNAVGDYTCDFSFKLEYFLKSFLNFSHSIGYFLLGTALLIRVKKRKLPVSFVSILCISVSMELLQMLSWTRRCRMTDMTPNFLGFAVAIYVLNKIYPEGLKEPV